MYFTCKTHFWFVLSICLASTHSQALLKSRIVYSSTGTQFSPSNLVAQLLSTPTTASLRLCATACNANVLCRVFDFDVTQPQQCRLFEGDPVTMGTIVSSASLSSRVGVVHISADLFLGYGLPCSSVCQHNRYLTCRNSTCQCMPHTYWDGSVCAAQSPVLGAACQQNRRMCREDLNYTCLRFNQCGRKLYMTSVIVDINKSISFRSAISTEWNDDCGFEYTHSRQHIRWSCVSSRHHRRCTLSRLYPRG